MDESKALSPEVRGLFKAVRSQAKKYSEAFETLEKEISHLKEVKDELEGGFRSREAELRAASQKLDDAFADALATVETKSEKISEVYENLDKIVRFKEEIEELGFKLKRQSVDMDAALRTFSSKTAVEIEAALRTVKNKTSVELEAALHNLKKRLDKELETELGKIDVKFSKQVKQIEASILGYEQRLWTIGQTQSRKFKETTKSIDMLKAGFEGVKDFVEDARLSFDERLNELDRMFRERMQKLNAMAAEAEEKYLKISSLEEVDRLLEEYDKRYLDKKPKKAEKPPEPPKPEASFAEEELKRLIRSAAAKCSELESEMESSKSKTTAAIGVAVVSGAIAIVAVLLALL